MDENGEIKVLPVGESVNSRSYSLNVSLFKGERLGERR